MTIFQAILLGIIQGLTEFIPVSSTAHLLLAQRFLGLNIPHDLAFSFDVLVQLGTLLALVVYFWKDLWAIVVGVWQALRRGRPFEGETARLGWLIVLATLPGLVAGYLFKDWVERLFRDPLAEAAIRLGLSAVLLAAAERYSRQDRHLPALTWVDAVWIGLAQVLSVIPGASRSGTTISGGLVRHLDRPAAARFAFLMSVPIMLAAGGYQSLELIQTPHVAEFLPTILAGFVAATVVGYLAIRWLLRYLAHHPLYVFSIYCALVSLAALTLRLLAGG